MNILDQIRKDEFIENQYLEFGLSQHQIAKKMGVSQATVWRCLKRLRVKCRPRAETNSGSKNGRWKGGRRITKDGYVLIWSPGHPFSDMDKYVLEHRLVVEKAIGRYLNKEERVHHINGKKSNNAPSNLVACQDEKYHQLLHLRERELYI